MLVLFCTGKPDNAGKEFILAFMMNSPLHSSYKRGYPEFAITTSSKLPVTVDVTVPLMRSSFPDQRVTVTWREVVHVVVTGKTDVRTRSGSIQSKGKCSEL